MQFGKDWPGTFHRGDTSAYKAHQLRTCNELLEGDLTPEKLAFVKHVLHNLALAFEECICRPGVNVPEGTQMLRDFEECSLEQEKKDS